MHHFPWPRASWRPALGGAVLAAVLACSGASAQTPAAPPAAAPAGSDPGDASAPVPALVYRSALQAYRPWREQAPGDWRALNDKVARIGGWRTYLREVQAPPASAPAAPAIPAAPAASAPAAAKEHHHAHH